MIGRPERATASLDRALTAHPGEASLSTALFDLAIRREAYSELEELIRCAPLSPAGTAPFGAIAAELTGLAAADVWPFAFLVWRVATDPRFAWLATNAVRVIDLADHLPLTDLETKLSALQAVSGQFLDQSVRDGTQTDGPLLI